MWSIKVEIGFRFIFVSFLSLLKSLRKLVDRLGWNCWWANEMNIEMVRIYYLIDEFE